MRHSRAVDWRQIDAGYRSSPPYVAAVTLTVRGVQVVPVAVDFACAVDLAKG